VSWVLDNAIKPIMTLTHEMETIDYDTLSVDLDIHTGDEIELLSIRFEEMLEKINQYTQDMLEKEQIQKEMEFDVLLSQVNPHYLYNVLNTVVYLSAAKRNEDAVTVTTALLHSLQETLKVGEKHIFTTVGMELELVKTYVSIQSIRYPDIFELELKYDGHLDDAIIPKTIIQPIVENSLLHGVIPSSREGIIDIDIHEDKGLLVICVGDNGIGIEKTEIQELKVKDDRNHIGLANIHQRIQYLYGDKYGLDIQRQKVGTQVKIKIPLDNL
jgi:sensor histidine kinase YesM